jgi:hypothetical protein
MVRTLSCLPSTRLYGSWPRGVCCRPSTFAPGASVEIRLVTTGWRARFTPISPVPSVDMQVGRMTPASWLARLTQLLKPSRCPGSSPIGSIDWTLSAPRNVALQRTRGTDARCCQSPSSNGSDGWPRQRRVLRWSGPEGEGGESDGLGRGLRHPDVQERSRGVCLQVRVTPLPRKCETDLT